jgi:hypothetical protein
MPSKRPNRRRFLSRPFWRDYLIAYVLIGVGFTLNDVAVSPPRNKVLQVVAATLFFAGLLVFASAIAHSLCFVMGGKPPRGGIT